MRKRSPMRKSDGWRMSNIPMILVYRYALGNSKRTKRVAETTGPYSSHRQGCEHIVVRSLAAFVPQDHETWVGRVCYRTEIMAPPLRCEGQQRYHQWSMQRLSEGSDWKGSIIGWIFTRSKGTYRISSAVDGTMMHYFRTRKLSQQWICRSFRSRFTRLVFRQSNKLGLTMTII